MFSIHGLSRISRQRGAAVAETVIAFPLIIMLGLGAAQWAQIYGAKVTLEHATFMGARFGAVRNGDPAAIMAGINRGLVPMFTSGQSFADAEEAFSTVIAQETSQFGSLRIINPTSEAFEDFAIERDAFEEIPNRDLHQLSGAAGPDSDLSIQDANILKIEFLYGYEMKMPFVGGLIATAVNWGSFLQESTQYDGLRAQLLSQGRIPIVASATVRMQSPARRPSEGD